MTITKITTHIEDARRRLLAQYRGKTTVDGSLKAGTQQIQDLEDCFWDMMWKRSVNSAFGYQLDVLGKIVGQPREGWSDAAYRIAIIAKIGVNISQGRPEDLIAIFLVLMGCTRAQYVPIFPAKCMILGNFLPLDAEQLLIDGNMEAADVAAWTVVNNATLSKQNASPSGGLQNLRIAYTDTPNPGASQDCLAVGEWYWLKGRFRTDAIGTGHLGTITHDGNIITTLMPWLDWYTFDVIFQATSQIIEIGSDYDAAGFVEFDSCSVRRLLVGNLEDIYRACTRVLPVGVKLISIGWFEGEGHDPIWDGGEEPNDGDGDGLNHFFGFEDDPDALPYGETDDPTVGGNYAELMLF
jgi:hypothetical protein